MFPEAGSDFGTLIFVCGRGHFVVGSIGPLVLDFAHKIQAGGRGEAIIQSSLDPPGIIAKWGECVFSGSALEKSVRVDEVEVCEELF